MRLIDADILEDELRDSVSDNSTAIHILNEAPTAQAIPIGALDKIRAEIREIIDEERTGNGNINKGVVIGLQMALDTIDRYKAESEET